MNYNDIVKAVCSEYGIEPDYWQANKSSRRREINNVTRTIAYLCAMKLHMTQQLIAELLRKNRTTVTYYIQRETEDIALYPREDRLIKRISKTIDP